MELHQTCDRKISGFGALTADTKARLLHDSNGSMHRCRLRLKCDGTCAETRFHLSAKRTSPFKSAGESVQSTIGSRGVRVSGSNAGYTMFRGSFESTHSIRHFPPSLPQTCVAVCHHVSIGFYLTDLVVSRKWQSATGSHNYDTWRNIFCSWL